MLLSVLYYTDQHLNTSDYECINPLTPTVAIWVQLVSDWVKPSFVIFDIWAL